ncbi:hypothetical protein J43TS3_29810 [Ornithinibacillus bavariensis]|uniref:Uncharacterized protein n=1 Tax=Ornithinibacillus bavariensis TaxID=545502 RepID=A0A919XD01_9BACI|nr:hypothetical protein J43TS3_29810 [Ornithinibacillus bavariensis]
MLLGIYLVTFLIGYKYKEKLIMKLAITEGNDGVRRPAKFLLYYSLGVLFIGIIGAVVVNIVIYHGGAKIIVFGFFYVLSYYLFAVSPAFLVKPTKALEMGAITEEHYNEYH